MSQRAKLAETYIVDADIHVNDTPGALAAYCDLPWRRSLEHLAAGGPYDYLNIPGYSSAYKLDAPFPGGRRIRSTSTAAQMRRELDELGVDIGLIFPDHLLLLAQLPNEEYAAALARAYNRWLVSEWLDERGLYAAIVATPQDPAEAAAEIRRHASHERVAAVYLPTSAVYPLWGHRCYDPIFAVAQEADLPVVLHSVTAVSPRFPFNVDQFDSHAAKHIVGHTFAMMANLVDMITTGVPARFPDLRIAFTEAGVSWVPFVMWRLDKEFAEVRREMPHLQDRPSTYIKRMYFSTQPIEEPDDRKQLAQMIEMIGHQQVLFASDWPHHDFDHPRVVFDLPLEHRVKEDILGMNAVQLFRLPGPLSG